VVRLIIAGRGASFQSLVASFQFQFTVSVRGIVCIKVPDPDVSVAVTVKVWVPTGVAGGTPVQVKEIDCGLPVASSVIVTDPARAPVAVGENLTLIWQFAPAKSAP